MKLKLTHNENCENPPIRNKAFPNFILETKEAVIDEIHSFIASNPKYVLSNSSGGNMSMLNSLCDGDRIYIEVFEVDFNLKEFRRLEIGIIKTSSDNFIIYDIDFINTPRSEAILDFEFKFNSFTFVP